MKPTIFLLGDSISLHYNPILIPATSHRYEWQTKPGRAAAMKDLDVPIDANGGTSRQVLAFLRDEEKRGALDYCVLLFNCGLHDIAIDDGKTASRVDPDEYRQNLAAILALARAHGIRPIWVTTTPVDDENHNSRTKMRRHNSDVLRYNEIAREVMEGEGIDLIDLYTFTASLQCQLYVDHVHYTEEVRRYQAEFIAQELEKLIEERN